jgi:hypothetical protein
MASRTRMLAIVPAPYVPSDPIAQRFFRLQLKCHGITPAWTAEREDRSQARSESHNPTAAKRIRRKIAIVLDFLQLAVFLVKPPGPATYSESKGITARSSATLVAGRRPDRSSLRSRTL